MASDGSIIIDVAVDTDALKASLLSLNDTVSRGAREAGASLSGALAGSIEQARASAAETASGNGFSYIGNMLAEGLADGIRDAAGNAVRAASAMIENVKSVIKSGVQVQSPSKWAEGVGGFIGEGLANGVTASAGTVAEAAGALIKGFTDAVEAQAGETAKTEIAAIEQVIEAEKAALKERSRLRTLEQRQHAVDLAVDADVKRRAIEYLSDTERQFALEDLEAYRQTLYERERALEEFKDAQIRAITDVSYEERTYAYDDCELKIKLYDEEYLAKVRNIDDGLYAFLSAKNAEMEAVIERIALEDQATAERLAAILEEKEALVEKSRVEKELREEKARTDKEHELLRRIWEAETVEESIKRTEEYNKWREDEEYRLAEKGRQNRISALNTEYSQIIETVKSAQKEIDALRVEGEAAVSRAAEALKSGAPVDLDGEKELLGLSTVQQEEYYEHAMGAALAHYGERNELQKSFSADTLSAMKEYYEQRKAVIERESANEYAFLAGFNNSVAALLRSYIPLWYETGSQLMANLYYGLMSRYYEVSALVNSIRAQLDSISASGSGGGYPMYGTGGVVTTPRLAIVGDTPEAIIPLSKLDEVIRQTAFIAAPSLVPQAAETASAAAGKSDVYINQTNNIYQPVDSPAETARAIKRMSRELARGY